MKEDIINIPFDIKLADSFFKRFKGLMFRKEAIVDEGLWITPCNSVHMFFMKFPIDVVLLTKQNSVLKVYPNLKPWRATMPVVGAYSTLELPIGSIDKLGIKVGDIIECSFNHKK